MSERNERDRVSENNPIGGELGQAPLVDADIAQDFAKAAGWVVNRLRHVCSSFIDTVIKSTERAQELGKNK